MANSTFLDQSQLPTGETLAKLVRQSEESLPKITISVNEETGGHSLQRSKQRFEYTMASTPFASAGPQGEAMLVEAQRMGWVDSAGQVTPQGRASGMSQSEVSKLLGDSAPPAPSSAPNVPTAKPAPNLQRDLGIDPPLPATFEAALEALGTDGAYTYAQQLAESPFGEVDKNDVGFVHMEHHALALAGTLAASMDINVDADGESLSEFVRSHEGFSDAVMAMAMSDSSHLKTLFQAFKDQQFAKAGKETRNG